jgi:hypothetical protein
VRRPKGRKRSLEQALDVAVVEHPLGDEAGRKIYNPPNISSARRFSRRPLKALWLSAGPAFTRA